MYSGVFDIYPQLKLIIGHMGEMLPMMMVTNEMGIAFLNGIELPDEQVRQIAHSNADKLLNLKL